MSPKRPVPITELLGHPPHRSPASSRIVPFAALGTQDGHRRKGRRAAAQPRPSRGAARSAPPGHVPHTAPLRLGPGPAPPRRAARDTLPLPAGLLAAAPRRSPPPAGPRLLRPPRSGCRRAPLSLPSAPLPGRPRAPLPIGDADGGARLGLGPAARGGAASRCGRSPEWPSVSGWAQRRDGRRHGLNPAGSSRSSARLARTGGQNSDTSRDLLQ